MNRKEIEDRIAVRAWQDEAFKQELLNSPKTALAQEGINIPDSIEVTIFEETSTQLCLVLPMQPSQEEELTDAQLEAVAGGGWVKGADTRVSTGNKNCCG